MTKEEAYDSEIFPLMQKIIKVCKRERIAFIADFGLGDDLHCTSGEVTKDCEPSEEQLKSWDLLRPQRGFVMAITEETNPGGDKKITMRRIS